jgi:hypothetical protein
LVNKFPERWRPDYAGANGRKSASQAFYAFEARPTGGVVGTAAKIARRLQDKLPYEIFTRIPRMPDVGVDGGIGSTLLGLTVDGVSGLPITSRLESSPQTHAAYLEVSALVDEYSARQQSQASEQPMPEAVQYELAC